MVERTLAFDLGGTLLRCAVVHRDGTIEADHEESTCSERGVDAVIENMADLIARVAREVNLDDDIPVGLGAPGPLNPHTGIMHIGPNLQGWIDVPVRDRLEKLTGRKVRIGNDANAAALGERYFGSAKGIDHLVYVALGTGFGAGVISNGILIDGVSGLGGELGHTCVSLDGPRCSCGATGCIEAWCSGWAIARDGQSLARTGRSQAILDESDDIESINARSVSRAARAGDPGALAILEFAGRALGVALANFANVFNPQMIVVGGGLASIGDLLLGPAEQTFRAQVQLSIGEDLTITSTGLGSRTGIYGAAALVFHSE